jgi:uncharacterized protein YndB with AHSA1/START domain
MSTEVRLGTTPQGAPALFFSRRYPHPRSVVWSALTTDGTLDQWFPARARVDAREGGTLTLSFPGEDEEPEVMAITEFDPPRLLAYHWSGEDLRWTLDEDGQGCVLRLSNTIADPEWTANIAAGWDTCLIDLAAVLDGGAALSAPGPDEELVAYYQVMLSTG